MNTTAAATSAPTAPNKAFTREQNLAIIARAAATVSDAVASVMEWRVELGNLFPTETYGNGCGGSCGRYGCVGNCIQEAWARYFSTTYDWPPREPPLPAPLPARGDFGGDMQAFSGSEQQHAGGLMGPDHPMFGGDVPRGVPPGARYDPVGGGGGDPTPDHLRVPEDGVPRIN